MAQASSDPVDGSASRLTGPDTEPVCERFEADWHSAGAAARPRIQDYLLEVPEPERSTVFCRLLALELKCREQDGEHPTLIEYQQQFPHDAPLIQTVFTASQAEHEAPTTSISSEEASRHVSSGNGDFHTQETVTYTPPHKPAPRGSNGAAKAPPGSTDPLDSKDRRDISAQALLPRVPGYEVLMKLGEGGMGIVYKARHLKLQRLVALKMIHPRRGLEAEMRERFDTEAAVVAKFQHPHLVQIYEIGEYDGQPYLALELLEGGKLSHKLAGTPQSPAETAGLIETLALALEYAHQKDIVHRDLKPSNVLLTSDGVPKITDFGLAKQLDQDTGQTEEGGIVGTPIYMAPEQAWGRGDAVGPRSDIYALGVILYEMLTGRPPFKAADKWQTIELVRAQEPVPPRRLVPQVPHDLELICLRCLKKDPHQRFASAGELAEELRRYQEGRPILTRPTPFWEKAWKWARRKPMVALASASLLGVSVAALAAFVLYLDERARTAERDLQQQNQTAKTRDQINDLLREVRQAAELNNLADANAQLAKASGMIKSTAALAGMAPRLADLDKELKQQEAELREEKEAHEKFFKLRNDALFHGLELRGVSLTENVKRTKQACQEALRLFRVSVDPAEGPVFSRYQSDKQRAKCTAGCYELLLLWAEAEAQPDQPGAPHEAARLEKALGLLDRAAGMKVPATGAYHLRRARCLELLGDEVAAERERVLAAAPRPAHALDFFLSGDAHQKQGRLVEASRDFARALAEDPEHFWARYYLAVCNLHLKESAQARNNLTDCMRSQPDFPWLYLLRGFAHSQMNDFDAARKDYQRALDLRPEPQIHYGFLVNQAVLCINQARLIDAFAASPWPASWTPNLDFVGRGAAEAYRAERLAAAADLLDQAVRLQPEQVPAYRYRALVLQERRQVEAALAQVGRGLEVAAGKDPAAEALLYSQRARLLREQGNLDAALADLERALKLAPLADDHTERGRILYLRQRFADALAAYEASLRLRPDVAEVYRLKAEALLSLHREADAVTALDQYRARGGRPTAEYHRSRAYAHVQLRAYPAALAGYTEALALRGDAATYTARGWVFLANGAQPLAVLDFEEAIRRDARGGEAYAGRALVKAWRDQPEQAIADVTTALYHGPKTDRLYWNAAHVYAQLAGRLAAAPPSPRLLETRAAYQKSALGLLQRALDAVPADAQADFWTRNIASDALLNPIRSSAGFRDLERKYQRGEQ